MRSQSAMFLAADILAVPLSRPSASEMFAFKKAVASQCSAGGLHHDVA